MMCEPVMHSMKIHIDVKLNSNWLNEHLGISNGIGCVDFAVELRFIQLIWLDGIQC